MIFQLIIARKFHTIIICMVQLWGSLACRLIQAGVGHHFGLYQVSNKEAEGSAWKQNSMDLSAYAGEASCQIRFFVTRGDNFGLI